MFKNMIESLQQQEQKILRGLITNTTERVHRQFNQMGITYWHPRQEKKYLIWLQWSRRLRVSLETVVQKLVEEYRSRCKRTGANLGLSIPVLAGEKVRQWLEQELGREPTTDISLHNIYQTRAATTVEAYVDVVNKIRRSKVIHSFQKPYRGSKLWRPPLRINPSARWDALLREFGYN